jgi:hypothetical protein
MRRWGLALVSALALAAASARAGPPSGGDDADGDTVESAFDNCTWRYNPDQTDTDHNGCGDACTEPIQCDSNGDTNVGAPDLAAVASGFGMTGCTPITCPGDCNGDTAVGAPDWAIMSAEMGNVVGPSGLTGPFCDPTSCACTP